MYKYILKTKIQLFDIFKILYHIFEINIIFGIIRNDCLV